MSDASRISPYSLNDLKNTTDDALGNYLRGLAFEQANWITDVKLMLGYTAVVISAVTFAADYKLGWEATKGWTAVAVVVYFLLNGVFTWWMWAVERGLIFEGMKDGKRIALCSRTKKHQATYILRVTATQPSDLRSTYDIKAPFTTWFTADGYFVAQPFQQWLASSVQVIGDVDKKNAKRDERDQLASPGMSEQDSGNAVTTGLDSSAKSGKKSKRKG